MHIACFGTAVAAAVVVALALPAGAATELLPGEWQTTETGTENGQPVAPEVEKDCVSPEEARDATNIVKEMKKQMTGQGASQCQTFDVRQSGNTVTYVMKCGDPRQFSFDISGTYVFNSPTRYSGTMKTDVRVAGQKTTTDKKIEAVHIGACPAGAGKKKK